MTWNYTGKKSHQLPLPVVLGIPAVVVVRVNPLFSEVIGIIARKKIGQNCFERTIYCVERDQFSWSFQPHRFSMRLYWQALANKHLPNIQYLVLYVILLRGTDVPGSGMIVYGSEPNKHSWCVLRVEGSFSLNRQTPRLSMGLLLWCENSAGRHEAPTC